MALDHDHPVDREGVARARAEGMPAAAAQDVSDVLGLLADPVRSRIVASLLAVGEMCVGDLALAVDASDDAVSYALRMLRTAGLVRSRRDGRMRFYRLVDGDVWTALEGLLATARELAAAPSGSDPGDDE